MDKDLHQIAKAPMIALIEKKNNMKTRTKRAAVLLLMLGFLLPLAALAQQNTLTVYDGTETNNSVPFDGVFGRYYYEKCEFVIPASELALMNGSTLSQMDFYENSTSGYPFSGIQVFLKEVDFTTLSDFTGTTDATIVYEGSLSTSEGVMSVAFTNNYTYNGGNLLVGVYLIQKSNISDQTTFFGQTVNGASVYGYDSSSLDNITPTQQNFIPKITFTYTGGLACEKPSALTAIERGTDYFSFSIAGGTGTYNVETKQDDGEWTRVFTDLTASTCLLEGLTPGTAYRVRVQSVCDLANSEWENLDFTTLCEPLAVPYSEGFESPQGTYENTPGPLPDCWDAYTTGTVAPHNCVIGLDGGSGWQTMVFWGNNLESYAILPQFDAPINQLKITFWMRTWNSTTGQFQLGYITAEDDGTCNTFTAITSYDNSDWGVLRLTDISQFDVPTTAHRLAFKWQGNSDLFIDNVEVALDFDCYPVSVLRYSEVAPHSVCLSWDVFDDSQTEWDVQVATDPDFTENVANHVADSIENYLLTGLNPNRHYFVRVKPTCNDSLWSNVIDFHTPSPTCNGAIEVTADEPYTEGFGYPQGTSWSTQGSLPPCWNKKSAYPGPHNTTGEAHSGTQALSFSNANAYAILPEFSNPLSELQISFWMETQYLGDFDELQLGYITADDNGTCNTFVAIATYNHTTSWVQRTTYLLNVPATAHRLAFKWNRDNRLCYIDDVEVSLAPDCYPVGNMSVGEVAYTSASLSWDLIDNSQTAWNVQVATNAAFTDVVADYVADSHENYLVEGLNSSTHYFVRVKSTSCGDDLWNTIEFWTLDYPCEGEITVTADAPYTQGFESPEGVPGSWAECPVPVCWGHYTTGNIIPHIVKYSGLNSTQCLMFYVNGDNYAILPEFSNPLDELQISFYMNMGSGTATLLLGYITAEDDGTCNTFTTIESYAPTNFTGFAQRITYLLNVPDTAHRLVFKKSGSYLCYIDDVEVSLAPDCYPVGNMSLGEVTSNSAYLSWDLVDDSQTAWDVQVSTDAAFTDTIAEYVADSHENYLLSGLSGGTHYYVRVRANCDDTHQSEWSDAIDFTTLCELIEITAETSYLESFESPEGTLWTQHGLLPPCWEGYSNTVNPAPHNTIDSYGAPSYAHSGEQCLSFHNSGGYAVLPELSNPLDELQISFWMRTEGSGSGELCLGYITAEDDGTCNTFTEIVSHGSNSGSMVQRTTYLPNVPATAHRLAFKWSATYYRCFVDDVEVSLAPDCYPVDNLSVGEVTSNSAYLSWDLVDDSQTAWDVQVSTDADFTNIVAEYEADSHENYLLEGLSHSTHYYVRVKPTCSDDLWSAIDFETPCGPFTVTANAPYTQDFEGVQGTTQNYWANGQVPACWEAYSAVSYAPHVVNNQGVYPTQTLAFYYNDNNYAALPEFSIPLNQLQIGFKMSTGYVSGQSNYAGQLQLGYITAEDDNYSSFTVIANYNNHNFSSLVQRSTVLENVPATAQRLVFKWTATYMICYIDDVEVSANPCATPVDLTCTGVTGTTATLAWTSAGESWQIMLNDDANNIIEADTNPFTLTDLTPDLTYNAKVRTACGTEWSEMVSFMPTENLYIGSSDGTSSYLPLNNYYNYSLTEQIYTAEELGETGVIERIGFFKNHNKSCERDIVIYMAHTDKSEFESTSDWITVTEADRVFSGTVSFDDYSWTDITLDEVFVYDGLHNVVIVVDDNTSSYLSTTNFSIYNTEKVQALYQYSDGTNFDPTGTLVASRDTVHQKNLLRILKSEFADCMKPSRLVATEVAPDFVVLDWEEYGTSENWLVSYDGTFVEASEHPFTLTGLAPETEYTIAVSPICDTSLWSRALTLTTRVPCPAPFNVGVDNITYNSANVTWTGYSESYTVHYRTAPVIAQVLLDEGFEGGVMPDGWYVEGDTQDTTKTWRVGVGDNNTSTGTHSGNYNALITHFTNGNETYLITPVINLSGLSNVKLSFWYINRIWSGDIDGFAVCYREGDYGDWEELWSTIEAHASWTFLTISLTGLPDNCQIGFRMTDNYGRGVGLDDILIGAEQIGEWEEITTTATSQALSSLVSETEYEVYVTADCDSTAVSETVNFTTPFVMTKDIVGYGESAGGYHLIASPVAETVAPTADNGFITSEYDLFYFDHDYAGEEWQNWKVNAFNLESGTGYLYASQENTTLFFPGTPYTSTEPVEVALAYNPDAPDFGGWNLVGNPFATTAFVDHDFYTMNSDGTEIVTATSSTVEAMEGIFVIAEGENESVTFSTIDPDDAKGQIVLNLSQGRGTIDRAIVRFDEGRLLPKFQLNTSHTKVYIPQGGKDYAIVSASRDAKSCVSTMDVNFKAAKNGTYTLTFSSENVDFDYLHLIDNLTGADVDLLAVEPVETATETGPSTSSVTSYTFTAKTTDYASRFKLVFSTNDADGPSTGSGTFAYISNGNIVITADARGASLQVVDVTGRVLVCRDASDASAISTAGMPAGVYILRLIDGDSVRTQKMVID